MYTTRGDIRGTCGHAHQTIVDALKCVATDYLQCKTKVVGYSDRFVERCDGRLLTKDEQWEIHNWEVQLL